MTKTTSEILKELTKRIKTLEKKIKEQKEFDEQAIVWTTEELTYRRLKEWILEKTNYK